MRPLRIVVLSNDVVPGMGVPVAAPGLRAWGLAAGLRDHGHQVTVVVDQRVARTAWRYRGGLPPAQPRHTRVLPPSDLTDYVRVHDVDALVVTNSNHVPELGDLGRCLLVFDFFAPKMLELAEQADPEDRQERLAALEARKLAALSRSDLVAVNGAKKLPYVADWLARSGRPDLPVVLTPMPVPPVDPRPLPITADRPARAIVSGYLQPWTRLGAWVSAVRPLLDDGSLELHVLLGTHWGSRAVVDFPRALLDLAQHPAVRRHRPMRFGDFRTLLSSCHVAVDVFERNPERELAMVTRSAVALSCGLPVLHVPFTEVSEIIATYDAGWLVDEHDVEGLEGALREVAADSTALAAKRAGAVRVSHEVLEPAVATSALSERLDELVSVVGVVA